MICAFGGVIINKCFFVFFFSVCTQLLVSRPDEENINCYLQLIEKCLTHEVNIFAISVVLM